MHQCTMKGIFITGTGTDVGKTIVMSSLLRSLYANKQHVVAIKPIQTGVTCDDQIEKGDMGLYISALQGVEDFNEALQYVKAKTLFTFSLPASPHLAAAQENYHLTISAIKHELLCLHHKNKELCDIDIPFVVEGAGGVLVPINEEESTLDLMQSLNFPVLIVMKNALGALNHTLLTIEVLRQRGLEILGVVATETEERNPQNNSVLQDNIHYLRTVTNVQVWELPYNSDLKELPQNLRAISQDTWQKSSDALDCLAKLCINKWNMNLSKEPMHCTSNSIASKDLLDWDAQHLWHPYTSSISPLPVYEVLRTRGTRITIKDTSCNFAERELIDGMASWWCAIHGYAHPQLVHAAQEQSQKMAHVMFGGLTHEPAIACAKTLLNLLPPELTRLFWSDSGSVSVEVALKMALQYQKGKGCHGRNRILTPLGGYHGDTMGAMSVCDPVNGMHGLFRGAVAEQLFIPRPSCRFGEPFDAASTEELEQAFVEHGHSLAAVILEPIVQGAGGMWFYHPQYLRRVRELCTEYQVLLIVDEIATGFGRTGTMFASEWADITPDIMCVGKGLTGGFMSLAATICTEHVAEKICADDHVFMHGPTFMGNPLACAVANASLTILISSDWQKNVMRIEHALKNQLRPCIALEGVADVRVLGAIGVVEMETHVNMRTLQEFFVEKGVWIRPFGKLIYIMPPYISTDEDIKVLCSAIIEAITTKRYL
ncbi:MAG: adenosylmethionine--8-amino-7-oxononanoate transaminase [Pseudomonadota bacterium]